MQNLYTHEPAKRCGTCSADMAKGGKKKSWGDYVSQAAECERENGFSLCNYFFPAVIIGK